MYDSSYRPPMGRCNVDHIKAIPPKTDITDPMSLLTGICKRMAYDPPKPNRKMRRRFQRFVRRWLIKNLEPFAPDETFDFEEWLSHTNYPDWRKVEIRKARRDGPYLDGEIDHPGNSDYKVKLFTKEEYYPEYKHFRGIWAREDAAKAVMGPFFHKVEKILFALPNFIKTVPKNERPQFINDLLKDDSCKYQCTDYTSYESQFTCELMQQCEFELYRHMSKNNPQAQRYCQLIFKIIAGSNVVVNKFFTVMVDAKRQSGEMNTSLGNGFTNLMILKFAKYVFKLKDTEDIVEGDDGLAALSADIPKQFYDDMGLNVKMETVDDISEASFCGLVYDPEELTNIRDPRDTLATLPWVTKKYAFCSKKVYMSLLKSKALSLIYEYPGCPIVYKYGKKIFDILSDYEVMLVREDQYQYERMKEAQDAYVQNKMPYKEVGPRTRILMEKVFKIPVSEQLLIESQIDEMTIDNFNIPAASNIMPAVWKSNYDNYVKEWKHSTMSAICRPIFPNHPELVGEGLISMKKGKMLSNKLIDKSTYYSNRINKDPKLYDNYVDRYNTSKQLHKDNMQPLGQARNIY